MHFEKATIEEIPLIGAMAERIWHAHYPGIVTVSQIDYMLDKFYSEASIREQMDNGQQFFIGRESSIPLGFFSITVKKTGEIFLHKLYIDTSLQRHGAGSAIIDNIVSTFDPEVIRLTVNRKNYKAINFYFRKGFVIESVEDFDIGEGYFMNDFVMIYRKSSQK
jgi:diamine N-acetyltransferase